MVIIPVVSISVVCLGVHVDAMVSVEYGHT